jgi:septum site-determining protein MinC
VIDIGYLAPSVHLPWVPLTALLKKYHLHAIAVRHASDELAASAIASGLCIDSNPPSREVESDDQDNEPPVIIAVAEPGTDNGPMIIDTPVRAGQRVYARGRDLIVTAMVNNGAEVIADGSIHVYAPLRGRALAGAQGNTNARIFVSSMEAELVSVAGIYRTFENGYPQQIGKRACQVRLQGDSLNLLPFSFGI